MLFDNYIFINIDKKINKDTYKNINKNTYKKIYKKLNEKIDKKWYNVKKIALIYPLSRSLGVIILFILKFF